MWLREAAAATYRDSGFDGVVGLLAAVVGVLVSARSCGVGGGGRSAQVGWYAWACVRVERRRISLAYTLSPGPHYTGRRPNPNPNPNQVNESSYCKDRYSTCDVDTSGDNCKNSLLGYKDSVCYKSDPNDTDTMCRSQASWDSCKSTHDTGKAVVTVRLLPPG